LGATGSYFTGTAARVRYRLTDPEGQIRSYVEDVIRGAIPLRSLDENFSHKDELAKAVKENLSEKMAEYGTRIKVLIFVYL
jgi:regulator of protease activity HflC (stomatin/prohibitin superfamily)